MSKPTPPQRTDEAARAAAALAVVEALYAFAEEPARWDDVIAAVGALPVPLDPAHDPLAASIVGHAARAAALVERLNAGRPVDRQTAGAWDAVLLSSEGRVRTVAGRARERLAPFLGKPLSPGEPLNFRAGAHAVDAALKASREDGAVALAPFSLATENDDARCFGVALPREAFPDTLAAAFGLGAVWAEPLSALVLLSNRGGADGGGELAPRRLGLTAAEARLAAKLAQGLQVADAAASLGISAHTARTQLKSIFAKTGARRQSELLRLLTDVSGFPSAPASGHAALHGSPPRRFVTLADGRRIFYREYGAEAGLPVVYFHVGLSASLVIPEIARAAAKQRVRLIAFERPGFGQSTPRRDYTFESVAADVEEFLRGLGVANAAFFGDGYGGGFAVAAARRLDGVVRRLALRSPSLGRPLANEQQSLLSALFRQPWIIPGLTDLMHRGIRVSLVRAMLRYYGERSSSDARRAADPEFLAFFDAAIFDAFERTGAGLGAELTLFASGARADPDALTCPIAVWHGGEHPGTPSSETIASFAAHPRAKLHILPGVGSSLSQPVFDDIFAWLADTRAPYPT